MLLCRFTQTRKWANNAKAMNALKEGLHKTGLDSVLSIREII